MSEEIDLTKEIIRANANALYNDSAKPSIRVLGKNLARCVSLFATPIGRTAEILEKNLNRYFDKLEGIDESEIVSPNTRVLVPILEKMRYTSEEEVVEYYAEILATASKKEHASKVMVTFIEILNRLTADEIKILEYINSPTNKVAIPKLSLEDSKKYGLIKGQKEINIAGSFPVIDINVVGEISEGYASLLKNFNCLRDVVPMDNPKNIGSYIDNMISLGLIERQFSLQYAMKSIYRHLENHEALVEIKTKLRSGQKIELNRGRIDITNLGKKLLRLCSNDLKS